MKLTLHLKKMELLVKVQMKKKILLILLIGASLFATSCSKKKKPSGNICYGQCTAGKVVDNGHRTNANSRL